VRYIGVAKRTGHNVVMIPLCESTETTDIQGASGYVTIQYLPDPVMAWCIVWCDDEDALLMNHNFVTDEFEILEPL
jgi:hypothetical protein